MTPPMMQIPAVDVAQASGVKLGEKTPPSPEQMKSLAAQFESVLLGQMMRQMRESMFDKPDDGESSGFSAGPLADQIYAQLSLALSQAGGLGLSNALGGALVRQAAPEGGRPDRLRQGFGESAGALAAAEGLPYDESGLPYGVSSAFGLRRDPFDGSVKLHKGTDIAMPVGSDVRSAAGGVVESVGELPDYGLTVVVNHAGGVKTRYAHLSEAAVKVGDGVTRGQVIAKSGNSGKSTGPHLHFEVIDEGKPVKPSPDDMTLWPPRT
jgi:murein DD-endopeptidase MepM/ murein hydrolase activator NlpD